MQPGLERNRWFRQLRWSQSRWGFRYISTMIKPALLSLVLLAAFGTLRGDAAPAPFSMAVVPSRSFGDGGTISMSHDKPQDFYVVLTNVSAESIIVASWADGKSLQNRCGRQKEVSRGNPTA